MKIGLVLSWSGDYVKSYLFSSAEFSTPRSRPGRYVLCPDDHHRFSTVPKKSIPGYESYWRILAASKSSRTCLQGHLPLNPLSTCASVSYMQPWNAGISATFAAILLKFEPGKVERFITGVDFLSEMLWKKPTQALVRGSSGARNGFKRLLGRTRMGRLVKWVAFKSQVVCQACARQTQHPSALSGCDKPSELTGS